MVSDLSDVLRHLLARFGRPPVDGGHTHATDENMDVLDHRLSSVEVSQQEIEARLRRLERQSWRD